MAGMVLIWILFAVAALTAVGWLCRWMLDNPRQDVTGALLWHSSRLYVRVLHRLKVDGRENVPPEREGAGPLIVVMNHTAGVDPVLVQAICRFHVRFVMAEDMRLKAFDPLWDWQQIIFVDRVNRSAHGTRDAVRHVVEGGVLGIYPEGSLERPARQLLPFEAGVGMLVRRTRARVLPIIIEGTPEVDPAWASLWTPSRSKLRVMAPIDYRDSGLDSEGITQDLQRRFQEWTGWPVRGGPAPDQPEVRSRQSDAA